MPVETMRLRTGAEMPLVGLGTAHLYREKGRAAVRAALDAGYRHIDCAKVYGNERLVGDELRLAMAGELAPARSPTPPASRSHAPSSSSPPSCGTTTTPPRTSPPRVADPSRSQPRLP